MIEILRTDSLNPDFRELVALLDADLKLRDGEDHSFYSQFNSIDTIRNAVVAYENKIAVACGAFKTFSTTAVEIKRMFVRDNLRGKGIARQVLDELEKWAFEIGYVSCVLETGKRQPEAIRLYEKTGYVRIPNYGQYAGVENSVCMGKSLGTKG